MDVVANNVANINTNGFKAEQVAVRGISELGRARGQLRRSATAASASCRTAPPMHDFARARPRRPSNPLDVAIDGNGFFAVQTPAGERYTRDGWFQINSQGQLVTAGGNLVLGTSGPIVFQPTDKDINISPDGTVTVLEGIDRSSTPSAASSSWSSSHNPQQLAEGRREPVLGAGRRQSPSPTTTSQRQSGLHRKVERQRGRRNDPHDGRHAHLYRAVATMLQQQRRPAQNRNPETCRRSGYKETDPCAHFTQQRPGWRPRNSTSRSSPTTSPTCAPPATRSSARSFRTSSTITSAASARRRRIRAPSFRSASTSAAASRPSARRA